MHAAASRPPCRWGVAALTSLVFGYALVFSLIPEEIAGLPGAGARSVRLFHDSFDIACYFRRGAWLPLGRRPYTDLFSEYPQAATYLFALTHGLVGTAADPRLPRLPPGPVPPDVVEVLPKLLPETFDAYQLAHGLLMVPFFLLLVWSVGRLAAVLGLERPWRWLLVLPSCLFFTVNRYDVMPASLTAVAILCLVRERYTGAFLWLAVACLSKWYPVVLVPAFIRYARSRQARWPIGPVCAAGALVGAVLLHSILWVGWDGFCEPYRFHIERPANAESLYFLLNHYLFGATGPAALDSPVWMRRVFMALQFSGLVVGALVRPADGRRLLLVCGIAVILFVSFARFYSPQWILWITPLVIPVARGIGLRLMLVAMDLASYLFYPIVHNLTWQVSLERPDALFVAVVAANIVIKLALGLVLVREAWKPRMAKAGDPTSTGERPVSGRGG